MMQYVDIGMYRTAVRNNIAKVFGVERINALSPQEEQAVEKARQVGDIHPNGKWVWTQLSNGRYDWRVMKKPKEGAPQGGEGGGQSETQPQDKQPQSANQGGQGENEPAPYDGLNAHDFSKWRADVSPDGVVKNPQRMAFDLAFEGENSGKGLFHFFDEKKEIDSVKKKMDAYVKDHPEDDKAQLWSELIDAKAAGLHNVLTDNFQRARAMESGIHRIKQLGWSVNQYGTATLDIGIKATAKIDFLKDTKYHDWFVGNIDIGGESIPLEGGINQIAGVIQSLKDIVK